MVADHSQLEKRSPFVGANDVLGFGAGASDRGARSRLLSICIHHEASVVADWTKNVEALPGFSERPREEIMANVTRCLHAFREILEQGSERQLDEFVAYNVDQRFTLGFSISGPLVAASQFRGAIANVLKSVSEERVHDSVIPMHGNRGSRANENGGEVDVLLAADALILQFERRFAESFAQRSIFASEERYRELFEHAPLVLATLDVDGRLQQLNERFESVIGPRERWIGRPATDLVAATDVPRMRSLFGAALRGDSMRDEIVRCRTSGGDTRVVALRFKRIPGERAVFCVIRDVTDDVARRAQIVQGEKLSSIGQLAASVAHELNNPMAWLMANLGQMRSALPNVTKIADLDPAASRALASVEESLREAFLGLERMREIVADLNVFSHSETRGPDLVRLDEVIELAVRMTGPRLSQLCRVERSYGSLPEFAGYPGRLSQVFVNLFLNAAQAMPDRPRDQNIVSVTAHHDGSEFVVRVSDNGRGVPPEAVERIFDPFFSANEDKGRSGLGLWVSKNIALEHSGTLEVESKVGQGTVFTLRLAGVDAAPARSSRRPSANAPKPPRSTVLFVDDEPVLLSAFARALEHDHDVLVAKSGIEALDILAKRGREIDVVFCDLLMPGMNGMDLHQKVGESFPRLQKKMVFMSGGAFTASAQAFLAKTTNLQIEKPVTLGQLQRIIEEALRIPD